MPVLIWRHSILFLKRLDKVAEIVISDPLRYFIHFILFLQDHLSCLFHPDIHQYLQKTLPCIPSEQPADICTAHMELIRNGIKSQIFHIMFIQILCDLFYDMLISLFCILMILPCQKAETPGQILNDLFHAFRASNHFDAILQKREIIFFLLDCTFYPA